MRRVVPALAAACLLALPTVLAFFSGGYFAEPQLIAGIAVWTLVLALAIAGPGAAAAADPGLVALGGLALMTAWTAASLAWAPVAGPALEDTERLLLYLGALLLALGALQNRAALRAVEPALAAGATIVIAYGLAGRLLPGLIDLARSRSAGGRLEQPLTYWNAEGALSAVGLVLCVRLAGDPSRPRAVRALAAAAVVPLAAGVYLSYSRGAIAVAALGIVMLAALARSRAQLRASAAGLGIGIAAALAVAFLPGVASLEGDDRTREGAIALALLAALIGAAAPARAATRSPPRRPAAVGAAARSRGGRARDRGRRRAGRRRGQRAAEPGGAVGGGRRGPAHDRLLEPLRVLATSRSTTFADDPLTGAGAGGFAVAWLQERPIREAVRDTHSIEFELLAELGLVGPARARARRSAAWSRPRAAR